MISISSIDANKNTRRGKQYGGTMGAAVGTGYIVKNRKDIFQTAVVYGKEKVLEKGLKQSNAKITLFKFAVPTIIIGTLCGAGALIGAGIGKLIDKHNQKTLQKKQQEEFQKEMLAAAIKEGAKGQDPISVEEIEELAELVEPQQEEQ